MHPRDHVLMAIKTNQPDIVAHFIHQIDLTEIIEGTKAFIQIAAELKHWDCVRVIAENKKTDRHDNAQFGSALLYAVQNNNIPIAHLLLKAGASRIWQFKNGNNCLHSAKSADMVALLLSFGVDFKKRNKAGETPFEYTKGSNLTCFNDGWKIYCDLTVTKDILTLLIQAQNQKNSFFGKLPVAILNYLVPFLCKPEQVTANKNFIEFGENHLTKSLAKHLVTHTHHGFFRTHPKISKQFVHQLTETVNKDSCTTKDIADTMGPFLKDDTFKKTKKYSRLQNQYPRLLALEMKDSAVGAGKISVEKNIPRLR